MSMSERELEEIVHWFKYRSREDEREAMLRDKWKVEEEVRRSHAEAAELRERVGELEEALRISLKLAEEFAPSYALNDVERDGMKRAALTLSRAKLENQEEE